MIVTLENELDKLREYRKSRVAELNGDEERLFVVHCINKAIREIDSKIHRLKRREESSLEKININNNSIDLPKGMMSLGKDRYDWHLINGDIYAISKDRLDKDGSFHLWNYIWIKDGKKYVMLLVRALGKDQYGDRIYTEARYYKDVRDEHDYLNKYVDPKGKYKGYVNQVIKLMREIELFKEFFKK